MICPSCNAITSGVINNRRELRCTACYAILPPQVHIEAEPQPEPAVAEKPIATMIKRKQRTAKI